MSNETVGKIEQLTVTKEPKRGEGDGYIVDVEKTDNGDAIITLPDELLEEMGWKEGDTINVDVTENCFDWGEVPSMVLRNLTKERNDPSTPEDESTR